MIRRLSSLQRDQLRKSVMLLFVTSMLVATAGVYAQDAVRPSLAGQEASDAREQDVSRIPYNLLLGPVRFRVGATVGVEYNDNINYADDGTAVIPNPIGPGFITIRSNSQDDVIVTPNLTLDAIWPVTQLNTLRLDLGIGYAFYLDHSKNDTDYILVAHHYNFVSTTNRFDYLNRNSEIVQGSAAFIVNPTITVGAEGNAVFTRYDQSVLSDNKDYSVGGFVELALTNNLKVRAAGGYQWIDFDHNFVNFRFGPFVFAVPDQKDLQDYYVNGLIGHRINAQLSQTVSAGHENQLGINSNYITLNYVRHTLTWNLIRNTLLSTEFFFEDAEESGGFAGVFSPVPLGTGEHFRRIGGAITLGYQLTPHVTLGVRYQGTSKDSNLLLRDYNQNRISVDGTYSF